jgi:hypothetical protein
MNAFRSAITITIPKIALSGMVFIAGLLAVGMASILTRGPAAPVAPPPPGKPALSIQGTQIAQDGNSGQGLSTQAPAQPPATGSGDGSTLLFTIPRTDLSRPAGIGVADDGTFWFGNADDKGTGQAMLHYDPSGRLLSRVDLAGKLGQLKMLKVTRSGIWVLGADNPFYDLDPQIYHLAPDGGVLDHWYMPYQVQAGKYRTTIALGLDGSIIVRALRTAEVVDPAGNYSTAEVDGSQVGGIAYNAQPAGQPAGQPGALGGNTPTNGIITNVTITIGNVRVPVQAVNGGLTDANILHVNSDGSCYALVGEQMKNPPLLTHTIFHYSLGGQLLGQVRVPITGSYDTVASQLAVGKDGTVYAVVVQPDRIELRRLNFQAQLAPLPTVLLPTDTPTGTVTPTPLYDPSQLPPPPSPTPISDLAFLAKEADAIVEVKGTGCSGATAWEYCYYPVNKWFKRPAGWPQTDHLTLVTEHAYEPTGVKGDGLMFLQLCPAGSTGMEREGEFCHVTEGNSGMFTFGGGKVMDAGITRYNGWSVEQFETELGSVLAKLPPASSPTATPVWDVTLLAQHADAINVVHYGGPQTIDTVLGMYWMGFKVTKSLKGGDKPGDVFPMMVGSRASEQLLGNLQPGRDYIVFQNGPHLTGDIGLFRIGTGTGSGNDGKGQIVESPLPQYTGWSEAKFEAAILAALNALTPTPIPASGGSGGSSGSGSGSGNGGSSGSGRQWDLVTLAASADIIAEVRTDGVPSQLPNGWWPQNAVTKWWKKPRQYWGNQAEFMAQDEEGNPLPLTLQLDGDYIVFIGGLQHANGILFNPPYIVGGAAGLFEVSNGQIRYAGISSYQGWTVDRFNAELIKVLTRNYTSQP